MLNKLLAFVCVLVIGTTALMAQGLDTPANKDDWEEINFEFDSSILTDGYPSLLRLSDLLKQNSYYRVTLEGHTDFVGPDNYNQALSQRRAETVREFLFKYGAGASQVTLAPHGEGQTVLWQQVHVVRTVSRRSRLPPTRARGPCPPRLREQSTR